MARPSRFELPEDVPVARIEEPVVGPALPPVAPPPVVPPQPNDAALEVHDVGPIAKQNRFVNRVRVAILGVAIGLGGIAAYNLWPEDNGSSTGSQAVEPIVEPAPPPPVAPAPVAPAPATPDAQAETVETLVDWVKGPVKKDANTRARLERHNADISITVTCLPNGYEGGSAFFSWKNELGQPNIPDTNANPLIITGYGKIPHPNTLCLEHTGEASQYTRYLAAQ